MKHWLQPPLTPGTATGFKDCFVIPPRKHRAFLFNPPPIPGNIFHPSASTPNPQLGAFYSPISLKKTCVWLTKVNKQCITHLLSTTCKGVIFPTIKPGSPALNKMYLLSHVAIKPYNLKCRYNTAKNMTHVSGAGVPPLPISLDNDAYICGR